MPVTYHHLVFTLPSSLNAWVSLHAKVIYRALFESVWNTLSHFGSDQKRLNGQIGATMVLHTWGENLSRHVHLHCLVPAGALGSDDTWHAAGETYLFPVRALSRRFRGRTVSVLRSAANKGELHRFKRPGEVDQLLDELMKPDWVVFSKSCPTNSGPDIDYLGRCSHRIAISDQRIVGIDNEQVRFQYKDYAGGGERKTMVLDAMEFIRRYLLHVLPKGLVRIRHYGLLANRCRRKKLGLVRQALNESSDPAKNRKNNVRQRVKAPTQSSTAQNAGKANYVFSPSIPRQGERRHDEAFTHHNGTRHHDISDPTTVGSVPRYCLFFGSGIIGSEIDTIQLGDESKITYL